MKVKCAFYKSKARINIYSYVSPVFREVEERRS